MEICKQLRQYDAFSIAGGTQPKVQECGDEATETVLVNGELHRMCARCAGDAVKEFDGIEVAKEREQNALLLRGMSEEAFKWASYAPPLAVAYLQQVSVDLSTMALDIMEGRA